ncbi:zinc-finger domain protein [Sulfolobus spindle-shaped virus 4]|uniref:Putative zinc finger, C2H2 type n=2 Tax=Alphafusellovirus TaxID=10475 RepID=A8TKJ7_9VIRU|nr:zinc-finger domain protein [Sulfolobus spindle-shaped virus 4]YP_002221492.1 zinc-finger domain protein [Sulfolobus spindle-shaped virus 5]ABV26214.1 putative zinc finger, C2H2 type [Sulfolobus spindle-shaped virus 4]ABV26248.1 putative C2H2-type zinc finger [Sulfolobus spindle-shaped virus 5]
MLFRCPVCGFTSVTLFAVKQHARKNHTLTKCPVCQKSYRRLNQHFYSQTDIEHLTYCYLYSTYKLPYHVRLTIKNKLRVE